MAAVSNKSGDSNVAQTNEATIEANTCAVLQIECNTMDAQSKLETECMNHHREDRQRLVEALEKINIKVYALIHSYAHFRAITLFQNK